MKDPLVLNRRREGSSMVSYRTFDDTLLIAVCERFLREDSVSDIAQWLQADHDIPMNRENVYPLLREARRRGFLSILPPPESYLQQRICDRFDVEKERIHVLRVRGATARDYVANAAAEHIVELIHEVGQTKDRVRIGLGGGGPSWGSRAHWPRACAPRDPCRSSGFTP